MVSKNVMFVDLNRSHSKIMNEIDAVYSEVVRSSSFIGGSHVKDFENEFAKYIGVRHCKGVASGSDALYLGLRALNVGQGDEVIVPSFTFTATVDAVVRNGATPVFVDIGENYNMDPSRLSSAITRKTRAIIPVHLYGNPANMNEIKEITDSKGLYLIEDAAQSHGARYNGKRTGSFGDISCFSFYPAKNLGAFGDGGAICTNSPEIDERIRMLREYGQAEKYYHDFIGVNSRLDSLQAAILNVKLKYLDRWNASRVDSADRYHDLLSDLDISLPITTEYSDHVYHIYAIRHKKRNMLRDYLQQRGIFTGIHYPVPVHLLKSYTDIGIRHNLKNTEEFARTELSLPMFPFMGEDELEYVANSLINFLK